MSDMTARFALPFILPGQAQKEAFHNEALARIDAALHSSVEGAPAATPPTAPIVGQGWIVGAGAEAEWSGKESQLAIWTSGGWRFVAPVPGMTAWDKAAGHWTHFDGAQWSGGILPVAGISINGQQVVGARQSPIVNPSGGTTIDAEARQAIAQITAALMSHGLIG